MVGKLRHVPWRVLLWTLSAPAAGCAESGVVDRSETGVLRDAHTASVSTSPAVEFDANAMEDSLAADGAAVEDDAARPSNTDAADEAIDASADGPVPIDDGNAVDNLVEAEPDAVSMADLDGDAGTTADQEAGSAATNPCPAPPEPCRILPLGDSITDGFAVPGGYRVPLFRRALLAAQHVTFVGSQQNGPAQVDGVPFPSHHEGHIGYAIDPFAGRAGISPLTPGAIQAYQPHIVTLMIGTNDLDLQFDVPNAPQRLGALLDSIFLTAPNVTVLLAQITPTSDDALNQRVVAYNAAMPALVVARTSAGRHIQLVDMYGAMAGVAGYQTALLSDRLHPNANGYAVMADVWYGALGALLR